MLWGMEPVGKCFDPISFECVDFQRLSQIIANLTREHLAEREAEITNLPWTQTEKDNALARCRVGHRAWCAKIPVLCLNVVTDEDGHPLENEDESGRRHCECWGSIIQARVEGPRHHQYENILRYVQKAQDDIRWTIDRTEFDEHIALKKDSAPCPDGMPYGAYKCAWDWAPSSFSTLTSICWKEVPFLNILLKVGLSLSSRPLTSMTMEEFFDLQTRFVLWRFAIVIANFLLLLSVEASIGTPWDAYILRRDASLPGIWQTTFLRSGPPLWLMLRALRRNQASYWRTLLPPIPASITPGSSPWLRKQNCLSFFAASYEVFITTASRTWNSREQLGDTSLWSEV